jgi:hypothetical protein
MSRYVITITPDNGNGAGSDTAHTTVRVDTSTGQTRITELTVRAGTGGGLAPADLPPLDLDLLVRALTAPAPAQALPTTSQAEPEAAEEATVVEPAAPAPRRRARKSAPRAKKATAAKKTARKAAAQKATGTRAYRRMPEPDEVMAAYQRTGSITAVAEHYDVPRHTVAGWARRLRSLGYSIGRQ